MDYSEFFVAIIYFERNINVTLSWMTIFGDDFSIYLYYTHT